MVTKVGRVVAETGGTVLGHMLEHVSGLPSGAPEILGTLSGLATSELVEPTVKVFTKPEMERQREYAIEALNVLGYGGPVEQACRRIDEKVNQGYFTWWAKNKQIGSFLKGLASRYGREQEHVKALLPKIKGEYTTRSVIIPILEECKYARLYETKIETTHDAAGACYTQSYEGFSDTPIGQAVKAIQEGYDSEVASGIIPREWGSTDRDAIAESKFRELKAKLPAIIDYLKD